MSLYALKVLLFSAIALIIKPVRKNKFTFILFSTLLVLGLIVILLSLVTFFSCHD